MSSKLAQIKEGWRNYLLPPDELKSKIEETGKAREEICLGCPFNSSPGKINLLSFCRDCGCNLKAKTRCLKCKCPKQYWGEVLSEEQDEQIKDIINGKSNINQPESN